MTVSKDEFERYEDVRDKGLTNMWGIRIVERLSGLKRSTILEIMKDYDEIKETFEENDEYPLGGR